MSFILDPSADLDEVKDDVQLAVASSGRFVDFVAAGHREVSALITPRSRVVFHTEDVEFDPVEQMIRNDEGNWDLL
ncbi:MAG: hypothetical protein AAGC61_01745 [Microbacterium sp.]